MARDLNIAAPLAKKFAEILHKFKFDEHATTVGESMTSYNAATVDIICAGLPVTVLNAFLEVTEPGSKAEQYIRACVRIANTNEAPFGRLDMLPEAFMRWMSTESIDGWLYQVGSTGSLEAWGVVHASYTAEHGTGENRTPAFAAIKLVANRATNSQYERNSDKAALCYEFVYFHPADVVKKSIGELMLEAGYFKETPELRAQYDLDFERFRQFQPLHNQQFVGGGKGLEANGYWRRDFITSQDNTKFVNDEAMVERSVTTRKVNDLWLRYGITGDEFTAIPVHPYLLMYDLTLDVPVWHHVSSIEPYVFDATLIDKLVLPEAHRSLIDVLVADMDVFQEDLIVGKSGGTAVLCYGPPGLGKTLTAEVYAEVMKRPLYKVHSGQLGTTAESVEASLKEILQRSERWGAVMLLDEADVYVAKRGNDLDRNAVVAGFLRTLEYFNGLMFLTTNRIDDVDDAILSRMIAMVKYEAPTEEMSRELWRILAKQFGINLKDVALDLLLAEFPGIAGRDIKQLLRLTKKYCTQKNVKLSIDAFKICAMFRGIK